MGKEMIGLSRQTPLALSVPLRGSRREPAVVQLPTLINFIALVKWIDPEEKPPERFPIPAVDFNFQLFLTSPYARPGRSRR